MRALRVGAARRWSGLRPPFGAVGGCRPLVCVGGGRIEGFGGRAFLLVHAACWCCERRPPIGGVGGGRPSARVVSCGRPLMLGGVLLACVRGGAGCRQWRA